MAAPIPLSNILFLDIETVSQLEDYESLSPEWRAHWDHKSGFLIKNKETETSEAIYGKAAIYAEFGKIVCISCGIIQGIEANKKMSIKSFFGDDEKIILQEFTEMLNRWACDNTKFLCAHNGKEFDFPYLCRRLIVHQMPLPAILQLAGKKPWEIPHIDTLELWKFGDYKNYTSLNLLACTLDVPTPKDDIDGSMVGQVYWKEKNIERIATYCQKDVITVAQVYLRMYNETLIKPENIEYRMSA